MHYMAYMAPKCLLAQNACKIAYARDVELPVDCHAEKMADPLPSFISHTLGVCCNTAALYELTAAAALLALCAKDNVLHGLQQLQSNVYLQCIV